MVDKFYVPYMEDSATDWSPNCVVKYEDYAALEKERNALKQLMQLAYDSLSEEVGMHWVNQAVNNLDEWLSK